MLSIPKRIANTVVVCDNVKFTIIVYGAGVEYHNYRVDVHVKITIICEPVFELLYSEIQVFYDQLCLRWVFP